MNPDPTPYHGVNGMAFPRDPTNDTASTILSNVAYAYVPSRAERRHGEDWTPPGKREGWRRRR